MKNTANLQPQYQRFLVRMKVESPCCGYLQMMNKARQNIAESYGVANLEQPHDKHAGLGK